MRTRRITVAEVEYSAYKLACKFMSWDEPIPDFNTRFPNRLESCLGAPFQTFDKKTLYIGLSGKAAALFYFMIKNHPFENGNKRIAVMTFLYFLHKQGKWFRISNKALYDLAVSVAESQPHEKGRVLKDLRKMISAYLIDLKNENL